MAGVKGRSGGARDGAGRKPAKPRKTAAKAYQTEDPDDFLRAVMRDSRMDFKDRFAAALALKKAGKVGGAVGKKAQAHEVAQGLVRRSLAPSAPPSKPRLVAVK